MKILLIRPPVKYVKGSERHAASLPLGLLYIAAVLEHNNYFVEIYDAQINVDEPSSFDEFGCEHIGKKWTDIEKEIAKRQPAIVGIICSYSTQVENAIRVAEIAKKCNNDLYTIVGGSPSSVKPHDFFTKTKAIDIVCLGEGEYTMLEIVEAVQNKKNFNSISGIALLKENRVEITTPRPFIQNLDELPLPAYHLINLEEYFILFKSGFNPRPIFYYPGVERSVSIITSRGCPFDCVFCSIHLLMGKRFRYHSAEYVLKHLEFLTLRYNIKHFHFEDDNLTLNRVRFKQIIDGLLQKKLKITWDTPNGVRADNLTKEIIRDCKKSGCVYLAFGIESGNQNVLDLIINKQLKLTQAVKTFQWCKECSLDAMAFFVIGFPGETKTDMHDTINFALWAQRKLDVNPLLFVATPLPGTRLEKIFIDKGVLKEALSPEILAKMTPGSYLLDGDQFKAADLVFIRNTFFKWHTRTFYLGALVFFICNPQALIKFVFKILIESGGFNKKRITNLILFKKYLK